MHYLTFWYFKLLINFSFGLHGKFCVAEILSTQLITPVIPIDENNMFYNRYTTYFFYFFISNLPYKWMLEQDTSSYVVIHSSSAYVAVSL